MSGNFVRERQRIVYIYNIHKVGSSWEICLSMRQISLRERVEIA